MTQRYKPPEVQWSTFTGQDAKMVRPSPTCGYKAIRRQDIISPLAEPTKAVKQKLLQKDLMKAQLSYALDTLEIPWFL